MARQVDLFDTTYGNFAEQVLAEIRRETYGEVIGRTSWIIVDEYDGFYSWLDPSPGDHLLEIASGSGGPALYLANISGNWNSSKTANELKIHPGFVTGRD